MSVENPSGARSQAARLSQEQTDADARRQPLLYLLATSVTQMLAAFGFMAFTLLAPNLAEETGQSARDFGLATTFFFIGTALSSPLTIVFLRRFGGVGTIVLALVWMSAALLVICLGTWTGTMLAALLFGLGYGPQGPLGMTIVTERTPHHNRALFLSIRQSAQPLAGVIMGRVLPPLMLASGWQAGVFSTAFVVFLGAIFVLLNPLLFTLRDEALIRTAAREEGRSRSFTGWLASLLHVPPELRVLWVAGVAFAITQMAFVIFIYLYLLEEVGLSQIAAGIFASNLQLAGLVARPVSGWICDRVGRAEIVLAGIAVIAVATSYWLVNVTSDIGAGALVLLAFACGVSGQSWNAVFTAAMSYHVPGPRLAEMNGKAFAFLSFGWMISAPLCWALIEFSGGYAALFYFLIATNVLVAIGLLIWLTRQR